MNHLQILSVQKRGSCFLLSIAGVFLSLMTSGCSSTHNYKTEGANIFGGGFYDETVQPGLHKLSANSNSAIWPSLDAARETWRKRADQLCGEAGFDSLNLDFSDARTGAPIVVQKGVPLEGSLYNGNMSGYVLCKDSGMTLSEAASYLQNQVRDEGRRIHEAREARLTEVGGASCEGSDAVVTPEVLFQRGKALVSLDRPAEAARCFLRAQEAGKTTSVYKESCFSLGLLYESGSGVAKDKSIARQWYEKAGL